jgi:plastocyanin
MPFSLRGMARSLFLIALAGALFLMRPALAANVDVTITGTDGRPAEDAVIELSPVDTATPLPATRVPSEGIIDQRAETFLPLVTILRKGGRVVFTNNDTTMHQVYSFSAIKQFEFEIDQGQHSAPVVFDQPGVAAIGCNIHDQMITYVYVATTPWVAMTDDKGRAHIDVPPGSYRAAIWDPQSVPGRAPPAQSVEVTATGGKLAATIALLPGPLPGKMPKHMKMY